MPTPKQAIAEALQSLDHTNDAHWTDDGSPLVSEIQRLANDKTITRAQINEALPGFARKTEDTVAEEVQPDDEVSDEARGAYQLMKAPEEASDDLLAGDDDTAEAERLRRIAYQRVVDAEIAITEAKNAVADATRAVTMAEQRHTRALQLYSSKYPPLTAAENIKQHLARQQEALRERLTGHRFEPNVAQNPVDATLMDRKRNNGRNNKGQAPGKFLPRSLAVGG